MKYNKTKTAYIVRSFITLLLVCFMTGCSGKNSESTPSLESIQPLESIEPSESTEASDTEIIEVKEDIEPKFITKDYSEYFDGINGAAVIFDPLENCYYTYRQELAETQRSPCSTFKIISSLIAMENNLLDPSDSTRTWSGETFWNENWNKDINFEEAFRTSCVWYFREAADDIGKDLMQAELDKLGYGNCDISDWQGELNTNNNNRALTGFWIESSLKISPMEQVQVMERIFGTNSNYTEKTRKQLEKVMRLDEASKEDAAIYGKTGMGKLQGVVVDAWYTGFADIENRRKYFCIYLGETEGKEVSSAKAREIAVQCILNGL